LKFVLQTILEFDATHFIKTLMPLFNAHHLSIFRSLQCREILTFIKHSLPVRLKSQKISAKIVYILLEQQQDPELLNIVEEYILSQIRFDGGASYFDISWIVYIRSQQFLQKMMEAWDQYKISNVKYYSTIYTFKHDENDDDESGPSYFHKRSIQKNTFPYNHKSLLIGFNAFCSVFSFLFKKT